MNDEAAVSVLLHWRLREAEAEAPPPPSAARLLERARPWWDQLPERARALFERLRRTQAAYGHAQADARRLRGGHPVPALVIRGQEEAETSVRVLYLDVRDGRMRLRFQLDGAAFLEEETLEATFVSEALQEPLFCAQACLSVDGEYRIDVDLPEELARNWTRLKVTEKMPFRLILRAGPTLG